MRPNHLASFLSFFTYTFCTNQMGSISSISVQNSCCTNHKKGLLVQFYLFCTNHSSKVIPPRSRYKYIASVIITTCDSATLLIQIKTFCTNQVGSTHVGTIEVLTIFQLASLSVRPLCVLNKMLLVQHFCWYN